MTIEEGKVLLQSCFEKCGYKEKADDIIIYKYGNKTHINMYQGNKISAKVDKKEYSNSIRYIVKCFIHTEIYVAWEAKDFRFKDTYICYKSTLEEMEKGNLGNWYESPENGNEKFYLFKGREGVMKFACDKIIPIK